MVSFTLPTSLSILPRSARMPVMPLASLGSSARRTKSPYQLSEGQSRLFHRLPSGLSMEVIVQRPEPAEKVRNQPLVFVHGSFHAAWCWAEHWLPFFSGSGYDCYAVSLLGQGESDVPTGAVAGSLQVTLSLAAKAFAYSLPLCKETFFSPIMEDDQVLRYQELMRESSHLPLFDLRKLNSSLPVSSIPKNSMELFVIGASDDFIVDAAGIRETAQFFSVEPVFVEGVGHDMMLDNSWKKGAEIILSWLAESRSPLH